MFPVASGTELLQDAITEAGTALLTYFPIAISVVIGLSLSFLFIRWVLGKFGARRGMRV